ncbi:hypothetical protein IWW39_004958 [Coemansia spiralis]|uniref:Ankyrin n=1 Tax=Coemansia spiralis TaxID=417178 RepID=A0A9W8L2W3_9FUNG|nr:hypothetical protein IWW39_004958 [Coemansia spiralis]
MSNEEGASHEEQLLSACMMDQSDLVKELLRSPRTLDINHTNGLGYSALHYAARTGSIDCVKLLAGERGINPNLQDRLDMDTPLHKALIHCEESEDALELTKLLLKAGSDPRILNKKLQRPVNLVEPEEEDIRRLLLQATLAFDSQRIKQVDADKGKTEVESDGGSCSSD